MGKVERFLGAIWMTAFVLLICLCAMCGQGCSDAGGLYIVEKYNDIVECPEDAGHNCNVSDAGVADVAEVRLP